MNLLFSWTWKFEFIGVLRQPTVAFLRLQASKLSNLKTSSISKPILVTKIQIFKLRKICKKFHMFEEMKNASVLSEKKLPLAWFGWTLFYYHLDNFLDCIGCMVCRHKLCKLTWTKHNIGLVWKMFALDFCNLYIRAQKRFDFQVGHSNYHISANSFRPWIVSSLE